MKNLNIKQYWTLSAISIAAFLMSCSTGPDYKRDSEYDTGSNKYRAAVPTEFSVSVTEKGFYQISWEDVENNDGFIVERYENLIDTTLYNKLAMLGPDETSFTDSSGVGDNPYFYVINSFTNHRKSIRKGRDSLYFHAEAQVAEIESIEYEPIPSDGSHKNRITIKTRSETKFAINSRQGTDDIRLEFQLNTGVIVEVENDDNSFDVVDTLWTDMSKANEILIFEDTVNRPVKTFRAKPILMKENVHEVGDYTMEVEYTVENPFRITLNRLDEIIVGYSVSVGEHLQQDATVYDGVYVFLNDVAVDTLRGDFPQTAKLNTKGMAGKADVNIRAFVQDYTSDEISEEIDVYTLSEPVITTVYGELNNQHTITWFHEASSPNFKANSFIIERRAGETGSFEQIAVVDADVREYVSANLSGEFYQYRVSTQTSNPGSIAGARYSNRSFEVVKTAENDIGEDYLTVSNDLTYRLAKVNESVFDLYEYQNKMQQIDLNDAELSPDLRKYVFIDASFSENGNVIVFLLREKYRIPAVVYLYDIETQDFIYVRTNLKYGSRRLLSSTKIAYSDKMDKIIYIDRFSVESKMGVINVFNDTNTLYDFPPGGYDYDSYNGLIAFDNRFLIYEGQDEVIEISNDSTINTVDYSPVLVSKSDSEIFGYRGSDLFVLDVTDFTESSTPVQKRISDIVYYHRSSNTLLHKGPVVLNQQRWLYAYDPLENESIKITDINFEIENHFMDTSEGIRVIRGTDEYLLRPFDGKKWVFVQPPSTL